MIIKLSVSKEKNLERLNKLTDDPAFIISILKNMGYKKCPDQVAFKIGLIKPKETNEEPNSNSEN